MEKRSVVPAWISFLDHYFFSKKRLYNLGLIRIALVLLGAYFVFKQYKFFQGLTFINSELDLLHEPSFLIKMLSVPFPLEPEYAPGFAYFYYFIAFCAAIGLFTRPALFIFGLATIYIIDVEVSRGFFNHEASLTTQVFLVLAFAPGSTSFSVDNFLRWVYNRYKSGSPKPLLSALLGSPVPVWGLKLIFILLASVYFTAGVSKLRFGGLAWLDGQTLTHYLDGSASPYTPGNKPIFIGPKDVPQEEKWKDGFGIYTYSYGNRQTSNFWQQVGHTIAANKGLIIAFSLSATLFELTAFLLLLNGWPRVLYLLGAILMHKSIGVLMNLPFTDYQVLCFLLIDWQWVYEHIPFGFSMKQKLNGLFSNFKLMVNKI